MFNLNIGDLKMESAKKMYMTGKVVDVFTNRGNVSYKVELYDLTDDQRRMLEKHQKAIARLRFDDNSDAKRKGVAFEDFVENYLAEHRTDNGIWVGVSDINVFGQYDLRKQTENSKFASVVPVPYDELPNPEGYTSEQIADAKNKKIADIKAQKLAASGFTGIIDPANF